MLEREISSLIRRIIDGRFRDLDLILQQDIDRIQAEAASRGMASSGATLNVIRDRCVQEIKTRADIVWQELRRVIETAHMPIGIKLTA